MAFRFLHAADIHLGYEQYNHKERYNDFARAFEYLVEDAITRKVDFLLLAGDLFNKSALDPRTLLQATDLLRQLREAGIPVLAVEGNHDRPSCNPLGGEPFSWLDYLSALDLLILLAPTVREGRVVLEPWQGGQGTYIDLPCGARVVGLKYYGASTPRMVEEVVKGLSALSGPRPPFTILMLHAGLQGILDHYACNLTRNQLDALRPYVDYLALGHIHKPFVQDDWLYNPGSLETNGTDEVQWDERGYFVVEVDPARRPAHRVTHIRSRRRAFERLVFDVGPYDTPQRLYAALERRLRAEATPAKVSCKPVVELTLVGTWLFDQADLDLERVEELVQEIWNPLLCRIKDGTVARELGALPDEALLSRAEIERRVLRELVELDARRLGQGERWAQMVLSLKRLALEGRPPEEIVTELRAFVRDAPQEDARDVAHGP